MSNVRNETLRSGAYPGLLITHRAHSRCSDGGSLARPAARSLERHARDAAHVPSDRRQGAPARRHAVGESLLARDAIRDATRSHDVEPSRTARARSRSRSISSTTGCASPTSDGATGGLRAGAAFGRRVLRPGSWTSSNEAGRARRDLEAQAERGRRRDPPSTATRGTGRTDAEYVHRYWQVLAQTGRVLKVFRARFSGKCSPVHYFWGAPDLAVTRFSGAARPKHPGGVPNLPDWTSRRKRTPTSARAAASGRAASACPADVLRLRIPGATRFQGMTLPG